MASIVGRSSRRLSNLCKAIRTAVDIRRHSVPRHNRLLGRRQSPRCVRRVTVSPVVSSHLAFRRLRFALGITRAKHHDSELPQRHEVTVHRGSCLRREKPPPQSDALPLVASNSRPVTMVIQPCHLVYPGGSTAFALPGVAGRMRPAPDAE